jgi:hypothetical protein
MSRNRIDWSKHEIVTSFSENAKIWNFKDPSTNIYRVTFINSCGVMSVTGDLGNWIFCREFHPSPKGKVCDSYWCEKLRISSTQDFKVYNLEETDKLIKKQAFTYAHNITFESGLDCDPYIESLFEDGFIFNDKWNEFQGLISDEDVDYLEWLKSCVDHNEGESQYLVYAHNNLPENCDHESVEVHYDMPNDLSGVFDAFDEMCRRMKK